MHTGGGFSFLFATRQTGERDLIPFRVWIAVGSVVESDSPSNTKVFRTFLASHSLFNPFAEFAGVSRKRE